MEKQQEQVIFNESEQSQGLREESRQEQFLMLPTVDFCFKELMEHEMVRHGFIAAVLGVSPNEIQATTLLPTNLRKDHKEDFIEMASKNEYINEEYNILKNISADEQKRLEYEAREKAVRDYNHQMYHSRQSGIREGIEQGIKQVQEKNNTLVAFMSRLTQCMIEDNRQEELIRSFTDKELQERLFQEYKIQ